MIDQTPAKNKRRDPDWPQDALSRFCQKLSFDWSTGLDTPCAVWCGSRDGAGYPLVGVAGRCRRAHRVAYQWYTGEPLAPTQQVHHICGNKACVNVQHMTIVTPAEHFALHLEPFCRNGHPRIESNYYRYRGRDGYERRSRIPCRVDVAQRQKQRRQARAAQERRTA